MASPHIRMPLPGPKARALIERDRAVTTPSYPRDYPFVMAKGRGVEVWDVDGNRFLDFASGIRLDDPRWGEGGQGREPVLVDHPDPHPPRPFVSFESHAAANGVDFCHDETFGFAGDAFVALFGDLAPVTTVRLASPVGFKVVRVDMRARQIVDFAINRFAGPASKLPHAGFERPSHCEFGPDGALYVVDWGEIHIAPERGGVRMPKGTGTLWRIRRTGGPRGERPPEPTKPPVYALQLAGIVGAAGLTGWALWRLLRRRGQ